MNLLETVIKQILFESKVKTQIKALDRKDFPILQKLWKATGLKETGIDFVPSGQYRSDLTQKQIIDLAEGEWFKRFDGFRVKMTSTGAQLTNQEQQTELISYLETMTGNTMYKQRMTAGWNVIISYNQNQRSQTPKETGIKLYTVYDFLVFYADKSLPLKMPTSPIGSLKSGANLYSYEDIMKLEKPTDPEVKPKDQNSIPGSTIDVDRIKTNPTGVVLSKLFLPWYLNSKVADDIYNNDGALKYEVYKQLTSASLNTMSCELKKCIQGFQRAYNLKETGIFDEMTKDLLTSSQFVKTFTDSETGVTISGTVELPIIDEKIAAYISKLIRKGCDPRELPVVTKQDDLTVNQEKEKEKEKEKETLTRVVAPANGFIAGTVNNNPDFYKVQQLMLQVFEKLDATSIPAYINLKNALQNPDNQGDYYNDANNNGATQQAVSVLKKAIKQHVAGWGDFDPNNVSNTFITTLYNLLK